MIDLEIFVEYPALFTTVLGVVGLLVGSFLNVVILRLPVMMEREWRADAREILDLPAPVEGTEDAAPFDLVRPDSHCPACKRPVRAWQNIPVISYMFLRGRCAGCGTGISIRYPLVEIAGGIAGTVAAVWFGPSLAALGVAALSWALIALAMIDYDTQYLPDVITLPFLWLGILLNITGTFVPLQDSVIGATVGYLSLWSVNQAFRLVRGMDGMAAGDFKLLAVLGAWLGWTMLPLIILLSSLVGAVIGIGLMMFRGHARAKPIPFGPYLVLAGLIAIYFGPHLMALWLGPATGL
ncbi:MAG: prepilin peptidase [Gammaproteobacteria bacterium]|nr:prepilin peptidase [Gammaproteobacteria bacterium]